ncbi:uncharacterized protein JCM10292_000719 [Rhodotorula paludigena]|uniref:uncharacterized protein n=1 Tax=Rhodotorula paludigena TaxID=86838 RepID=UPI00317579ED
MAALAAIEPAPHAASPCATEDAKSTKSSLTHDSEDGPVQQTETVEQDPGVTRIEALYKVFGTGRLIWLLYISIGLMCYITALAQNTTSTFLAFATSAFSKHSLLGAISVAVSLIGAVAKPVIAKVADITSRPWAYAVSLVFYVLGFIIVAASNNVNAVAAGELFYTIGSTGLDLVTDIIVGDITPLKWRGFVSSLTASPFIINAFIAGFITDGLGEDRWRWGYGMFAIMTPVLLAPALMILFWADIKAKKLGVLSLAASSYTGRVTAATGQTLTTGEKDADIEAAAPPTAERGQVRSWLSLALHFLRLIDAFGILLLAVGWALVLLPFTLYKSADGGWKNPSLIAMMVVGGVVLISFLFWEKNGTSHPVCPRRVFNRTFICAIIIDVTYELGGYIRSTYFSSFIWVITDWNLRDYTFFLNTLTVGLCVFGLLAGLIQRYTRDYKYLQIAGLCIRTAGLGLTFYARGRNATDAALVWTQILIALGGAFSVVGSRVASQASVPHADLATVIALLALFSRIGSAMGSAIAAAVWTGKMPAALHHQLDGRLTASEIAKIFGSIKVARNQPDEIRQLVINAYNDVVGLNLYLPALLISVISIVAGCCTQRFYLGNRHNAVEDKVVVAGREREEAEVREAERRRA